METVAYRICFAMNGKKEEKQKINKNVEIFYPAAREILSPCTHHVNNQGQRITDANWASDSRARRSVAVSYLHVALGRTQGEHHRVS